jgi:hypothetical protein
MWCADEGLLLCTGVLRPPLASSRVGSIGPADAMTRLELVVFGAACHLFGLVSSAVLIPWLVDLGLFPIRRHDR